MTARGKLFKQLAHQHQKLQTSFDGLCLKMNNNEEEHKRALEEEKSEVTRLQRELNRVERVKDKVKEERDTLRKEKETIQKERDTLKAGLQKRAELDKEIQTAMAESEAEVKAAKEELRAHKAASAKWLADLASLNEDMDRKLAESPFFPSTLTRYTISCFLSFNSMLAYIYVGEFTNIRLQAAKVVREARAERAKLSGTPLPEIWDIEDHITALKARIAPLKDSHIDLLNAGLKAHRALFPEARQVRSAEELINALDEAQTRLRHWRSSSARAGADAALLFIMSWYELIDLVKVRSFREGSPWATDPNRIKIREEAANFMAEFASTKHLDMEAPIYSDGEETEEEESDDASVEEYAQSEAESDDSVNSAEHAPIKSIQVPPSDSAKTAEPSSSKISEMPVTDSAVITEQASADPDISESAQPSSSPSKVIPEVPPSSGSTPATEPPATESTSTEAPVTTPLTEAPTTEVPATETPMTESAATESAAP